MEAHDALFNTYFNFHFSLTSLNLIVLKIGNERKHGYYTVINNSQVSLENIRESEINLKNEENISPLISNFRDE